MRNFTFWALDPIWAHGVLPENVPVGGEEKMARKQRAPSAQQWGGTREPPTLRRLRSHAPARLPLRQRSVHSLFGILVPSVCLRGLKTGQGGSSGGWEWGCKGGSPVRGIQCLACRQGIERVASHVHGSFGRTQERAPRIRGVRVAAKQNGRGLPLRSDRTAVSVHARGCCHC